ncbi:MAG: D-alanine--poly(phosphoribitol) ligase [Treponema sp. CETP13]|nr:MAG: D-alanine--poly(phosphoribitol) ligase [Treponema sp. CETP13]
MNYSIIDLLKQDAQLYPNKISFADVNNEITFAQLNKKAQEFASGLLPYVKPTEPIVFFMNKSVELIIGFMGTVYAGCCYSVMDVNQPEARMLKILEVLQPALIITTAKNKKKLDKISVKQPIVLFDSLFTTINKLALDKIDQSRLDIDPLYINFTSGSTGIPKGVAISNRSVLEFMEIFPQTVGIMHEDIIGNQAPWDFDVSVKDIYSGLKMGATVQIIPRMFFSFPTKLLDFLCERNITTLVWAVSAMCFVSTMKGFEYKVPSSVNKVMFSGEIMPIKHYKIWKQFLPNAQFINLYGPTEITCNCTYYKLDSSKKYEQGIPIGTSFKNEKVFLLDEHNNLVKKTTSNVLGEICVSGTALGLGYYNNGDKTNEAFVQNPLNHLYYERIYRTGDIGKYDSAGNLYYVTRKDFQIKHLGHRIELFEIEQITDNIENVVRSCCVYDYEKKRLVLFYVGSSEEKEVKKQLKELLPMYMMPNHTTKIDRLPMTKNGKIDRKLLLQQYKEG